MELMTGASLLKEEMSMKRSTAKMKESSLIVIRTKSNETTLFSNSAQVIQEFLKSVILFQYFHLSSFSPSITGFNFFHDIVIFVFVPPHAHSIVT